ncbi:MAG: rRNA maturation RNase YbeY [Chloroflexi bacterium]|nr:rRNA maturation RNase YbeY [Chloroflexota bacterium]MBI2983680.1 rRNA maturation RNase YbeY [Chloroflexota bacterium]
MRITVSGRAPVDLAAVRRAIRGALRPYGLPGDTAVALAFVGDERMRELNRRHRRTDRTTDVLSFGQRLPRRAKGAAAAAALRREPDGTLELGDIVISVTQAERQARRGRRSLDREVAFLAAHGALHLLGFEDRTPAGYREMVRSGTLAVGNVKDA